MTINLKDNIWIEGFDEIASGYILQDKIITICDNIIYSVKTSEIPEELAKECVKLLTPKHAISLYQNYKYKLPQLVSFTRTTARESIKTACYKEYCIIYKTK